MSSLRTAARAALTTLVSLGLLLGLVAFVPAASAAPSTGAPTSNQQCLDARDRASASRSAYGQAVAAEARAKRKAHGLTKKLTKAKKSLKKARQARQAGTAPKARVTKAAKKVRTLKGKVKRQRAAAKRAEATSRSRQGAAQRDQAAASRACASQPSTKGEAQESVQRSITLVTELTESSIFTLLPTQLSGPLSGALNQVLLQLTALEALIPSANAAEFQKILDQVIALDPTALADNLGDLQATLEGIVDLAGDAGGPAELVALFEALLGQLGGGGLPQGADLTTVTTVLAQVIAQVQAVDPTGLSSALDAVADVIAMLGEVLGQGESQLGPVVGLLGALGGGNLDPTALQGLIGALVGALAGGALPGVGDLPFPLPGAGAGADQLGVLLTTLTGLLGGNALPTGDLETLLGGILGNIPGLPDLGDLLDLPGIPGLPGLPPICLPLIGCLGG